MSACGTVLFTILIMPPPTSFLNFTEREIGFDAGGVTIHHETDRARRRENGNLRIAIAVFFADFHRVVPSLYARLQQCGCTFSGLTGRKESRCRRITSSIGSRFISKPSKGPSRSAMRADCA